jgi:hypothetical protein
MTPVELRTENHCADEGQQQFTQLTDRPIRVSRVMTQKNMVINPTGPGSKNGCGGKGQQQLTLPTYQNPIVPGTKNDYAGEGQQQFP